MITAHNRTGSAHATCACKGQGPCKTAVEGDLGIKVNIDHLPGGLGVLGAGGASQLPHLRHVTNTMIYIAVVAVSDNMASFMYVAQW